MKRILVLSNDNSASAFYRHGMPFIYLEKYNNVRVDHVSNATMDWSLLCKYDILFIWTPYKKNHLDIIEVAKNLKLKVWVDCDDHLLKINTDNPAYVHYDITAQRYFTLCLQAADLVTVSTAELKNELAGFNQNIHIVRNGFPLELTPIKPSKAIHNFITWRGSAHHKRDLAEFSSEIIDIYKTKDWVFNFVGEYPSVLHDSNDIPLIKFKHYPWKHDVLHSFQTLQMLSSKIHIVPLVDTVFNRSKSNIAWIEATLAGSICVVPDWEEWPEYTFRYNDKETFKKAIESLIDNNADSNAWELSWSLLNDHYDLKKVNNIRKQLIESL